MAFFAHGVIFGGKVGPATCWTAVRGAARPLCPPGRRDPVPRHLVPCHRGGRPRRVARPVRIEARRPVPHVILFAAFLTLGLLATCVML